MDAQGQPVAGARVTLAELSTATRTDAAGAFAFGVARGRYTVVVEGSGFVSATQTVTVPSAETIDITVQEGVLRLDPVNVTATRAPADAMRSPLPVTMMGEERVRREHSVSLAKAVSQLAGVHAVSTGEQIGKPVLRGLSGARVLVLENGHRLEDYSWSDEDGPSVESRLEQRIEVIRGPASVLYGSDAIGGVINALPAALPDATSGHGFGRGEVEAYAASNNREVGTALRYEGASGRLGWRAFLVGRFGEDLHTPAGKLENTGFGAANGEILLGMHSGAGTSTLRYSRYGGEFKLLEANGPPPGTEPAEEEGPERKLSDDRVQFDGNYLVGPVRLETKGQWQRHFISELSDDLSQGGQKVETEVFNLVLNTLTGDVLLHHGGERQSGSVGVSFFHQNNDTRGVVPLVPDAGISSFAGFAFEQWNADHVSLLGGARLERRAVDAKANSGLGLSHESRDYTVAVGNLGLVLRAADGLALALNAGRAWRAPNLFEMFANGPRLGEARYEIGRADLEAETSFNLDAALRWERPRLRGELAAYRNRISNYIHVTPTSDFINNLRVFRYLQGDATLTGGEVSLEAEPTRALTVRGRYDRVHADNDESDEPLPLVPPATGAIEAELHRAHFGWVEQGYLGAELEFAAKKSRLAANELGTDGYTLVHFEAGVQHRFGARRLRLDLRLRNATNVSYRNFLSRYKEFAEDPGRNIVLRLSTEL
jgi:outer membrane receptor protein involved in Fe transport